LAQVLQYLKLQIRAITIQNKGGVIMKISLIMGIISLLLYVNTAYGKSVKPVKEAPGCQKNLVMCLDDMDTCDTDLGTCDTDLAACEAAGGQIFPGDGYTDPSFGTIGHGTALSYTDNSDGTFTDDNTGCMWEIKDDNDGIHDKDNTYTWSSGGSAADGSLFTDFLDTLNNTCQNDETVDCTTDDDCSAVGGPCGFAGYRDWEIPNVKILQSIVDYSVFNPASIVPGATRSSAYWSSTTFAGSTGSAWGIYFSKGFVFDDFGKSLNLFARAVRPCS